MASIIWWVKWHIGVPENSTCTVLWPVGWRCPWAWWCGSRCCCTICQTAAVCGEGLWWACWPSPLAYPIHLSACYQAEDQTLHLAKPDKSVYFSNTGQRNPNHCSSCAERWTQHYHILTPGLALSFHAAVTPCIRIFLSVFIWWHPWNCSSALPRGPPWGLDTLATLPLFTIPFHFNPSPYKYTEKVIINHQGTEVITITPLTCHPGCLHGVTLCQ